MLIKVCGMRDADNIRAVEALLSGCDENMMGFIFWPPSKRYVSQTPAYLPTKCKRVGVFVDEDVDTVRSIARDMSLDFIQLHGSETPDYCAKLSDYRIIKAFSISRSEDLSATQAYDGCADYFLFDTKTPLPGGSGQQFDWSVLDDYQGATPFLLSGGIGPDDAERVKAFRHPRCIGVDLNSRFEIAPGLKDIERLNTYINTLCNDE